MSSFTVRVSNGDKSVKARFDYDCGTPGILQEVRGSKGGPGEQFTSFTALPFCRVAGPVSTVSCSPPAVRVSCTSY